MHLLINKKKIYFYIFSFFILTTIFNKNFFNSLSESFLVKKIDVETDNEQIKEKILNNTEDLINNNILSIDKKTLVSKLNELNFLKTINITKSYPSTLIIDLKVTKIIAITYIDQKKYYVGENGHFIIANKIDYEKNIPIIFGKFQISDFIKLRNQLQSEMIDYKSIIKYFYHKNKRWDLHYPNNIIIKLPNKDINYAVKVYKEFKNFNKIKPNTIIDLRVSNRLILNND